jgi:hypothetical protein
MAKTLEDVAVSREARERIERLFGGEVPDSILRYNCGDKATDLLVEEQQRGYLDTGWIGRNRDHKLRELFKASGCGARWGALSRFPQNVGRTLLKLYSKSGDTVVDPFAGHNSRMELCWRAGRNYIGCDVSKVFMAANHELRRRLLGEDDGTMFKMNRATIELHECDSRKMPIKNNTGDFTITSPPYWDLEDYGDEIEQLGKGNDYHEFLRRLGEVAADNFRCLRSGSFCVWCVNDFRKDGKFYCYHMDTARALRDAGFKMHDIGIIDLLVAMRRAFATQVLSQQILPKRHEYALIFVKP